MSSVAVEAIAKTLRSPGPHASRGARFICFHGPTSTPVLGGVCCGR